LTGLIQSKGQPFQLRREELATFGELQEGRQFSSAPSTMRGPFD